MCQVLIHLFGVLNRCYLGYSGIRRANAAYFFAFEIV